MLVLSRDEGESIVINDNIVVTILRNRYRSDAVRIGIEAPYEIEIVREEIIKRSQTDLAGK